MPNRDSLTWDNDWIRDVTVTYDTGQTWIPEQYPSPGTVKTEKWIYVNGILELAEVRYYGLDYA